MQERASWDLCLQPTPCQPPAWDIPESRRSRSPTPQLFASGLRSQTVELLCKRACWFSGAGNTLSLGSPSTYPAWGWGESRSAVLERSQSSGSAHPRDSPSRGIGPGRSRPLTPKLESTLVFSSNSGAVADRPAERRGNSNFVACRGLRVRWPAAAACQRRRRNSRRIGAEIERQLRRDKKDARRELSSCCCWVSERLTPELGHFAPGASSSGSLAGGPGAARYAAARLPPPPRRSRMTASWALRQQSFAPPAGRHWKAPPS